ncbi:MAG: hypothetical protein KOO63_12975 [Bacteroidales bacterium]|nr:hypothetical protein [Candidatus Latescibacterota bacterium]
MPINREDKGFIIDQMENMRTKGSRLVISLRFAGETEAARKAKKKVDMLGSTIDELLAESMKSWTGNGKSLIDDIKWANQQLQRDINDIKKKKNLAQKSINAFGCLDDVIVKVKDILGKIQ